MLTQLKVTTMKTNDSITIYDNGNPVGDATIGSDHTWSINLNNLEKGTHVITARQGSGVVSASRTFNVSSITEDWGSIPIGDLKPSSPYFLSSSLIFHIGFSGQAVAPEFRIEMFAAQSVLSLIHEYNTQGAVITFLFPSTIPGMAVGVSDTSTASPTLTLGNEHNEEYDYAPILKPGINTVNANMRYFRLKFSPGNEPFQITKLSWASA